MTVLGETPSGSEDQQTASNGRFFSIRVDGFILGIIDKLEETEHRSREAKEAMHDLTPEDDALFLEYLRGRHSERIDDVARRMSELSDRAPQYQDQVAAIKREGRRVAAGLLGQLSSSEEITIGRRSYHDASGELPVRSLWTTDEAGMAVDLTNEFLGDEAKISRTAGVGDYVIMLTDLAAVQAAEQE